MLQYTIKAPRKVRADIQLPASKSISNRALIVSALAQGGAPLNVSECDDTDVMVRALAEAGEIVDIGAAGTAMRFLTAYLSVTEGERVITGTERMRHRPIGVLVDALRALGADIEYMGECGYPPLSIRGRRLAGGEVTLKGDVSSQYISALMMVGPVLESGLRLTLTGEVVSRPYIELTMRVMRAYGATVSWEGESVVAVAPGGYRPAVFSVEADWSASSYWYEIVALSDEAEVRLPGLERESGQGDSVVASLFERLGVKTEFTSEPAAEANSPAEAKSTAEAVAHGITLRKTVPCADRMEADFTSCPDLTQTLVVTCCVLGVPFRFTGLQSLRIKETDRIAALVAELAKWGYELRVEGDSVVEYSGRRGKGKSQAIDTYDDHRMAMAFAPAALRLGQVYVNNPQVVSKSYPSFWRTLLQAGFEIEGREVLPPPPPRTIDQECCGQHEVCERDSLLAAVSKAIEYYDDEELDRFHGRDGGQYTEAEAEEFREVLYTMRNDDVAGWVRSLQLRAIELPDTVKDEVLLIIGERRQ